MRHETQKTETFTTVSYTCDVCGGALLAGEKPTQCIICGRDTHRRNECRTLVLFEDDRLGDPSVLCLLCQNVEDGVRGAIRGIIDEVENNCQRMRNNWKERSLRHGK